MASIFTFDPDPPRVASPWATTPPGPRPIPQDSLLDTNRHQEVNTSSDPLSADCGTVTRLEAEPQDGPTEYKLHLLLRRRRSFLQTSTGRHISGSLRRAETLAPAAVGRSVPEYGPLSSTPPPQSASQSRQHRLEQLTTQLIWRLQQSCPYHLSSSTSAVIPQLPDEAQQLSLPVMPQRLLPGLEESRGALYEIGVADDGTFVGLAEDEMEESLNNLRAMAASLGCRVIVQRMVSVGQCEWVENAGSPQEFVRFSKLLVAEALVCPEQHLVNQLKDSQKDSTGRPRPAATIAGPTTTTANVYEKAKKELRVSFTGATMSGKSSLLGSLTTATLDNGRGKSRLSLLRHRHEIATGMTSSVTQELIGYRDDFDQEGGRSSTQVVSYGSGDVTSWLDIHAVVDAAEDGRLIFISDSAGHPRFCRTTVRGLVGWAPHWTLLAVPADNTEDSSGRIGASPSSQEILGKTAADFDLSQSHLQLCLNLELPLVVIITKYDLATKAGLKQTLARVLSILKEAGRKPCIIGSPSTISETDELDTVSLNDLEEADGMVRTLHSSPLAAVPIIFTSAVNGSGIKQLHAFLRELPIPEPPSKPPDSPQTLFHIEDIYKNTTAQPGSRVGISHGPTIIGGHMRYGRLSVGDELTIGPYPVDSNSDDSDSGSGQPSGRVSSVSQSRSFPGASQKCQTHSGGQRMRSGSGSLYQDRHIEWRRVRVTTIRNLRLSVTCLRAGQVGTVAIVPIDGTRITSPIVNHIRKGMVLVDGDPLATRVVGVRFSGANAESVKSLGIGSMVSVYVASVRATAKVISVSAEEHERKEEMTEDEGFGFGFDEDFNEHDGTKEAQVSHSTDMTVMLQFITSKEYIETEAKVLVLPGGGPGLSGGTERGEKGIAGLEGFVGRVVKRHG